MPNFDDLVKRLYREYPRLEDNYHRGKAFESVCKWFLENDPTYKTVFKHVWLWDDWPGRDGPDTGIDLVAEHFDDAGIVAIQAKFHAEQVPTQEIDRFIVRSDRFQFSERLLISTSGISEESETALRESHTPSSFIHYSQLEDSAVDWLAYFDQSRKATRDPYTPYPHQENALSDIMKHFTTQDRGKAIMACGTGKTLVGLWTAERLGSHKTLVLVPSLSLISQISNDWHANASTEFRSLLVCSDVTAVSSEDDIIMNNTSDLGRTPTTDPVKIKEFLDLPDNQVVFSTYHSSLRIAEAQEQGAQAFDIVIADEAHHCVGKAETFYTAVLDETKIRGHKRLFMTATPRNTPAWVRRAVEDSDRQTVSMNDVEQFGETFHTLPFGKAIEDGLLANYEVVIAAVTTKQVAELIGSRRFIEYKKKFRSNAEYFATIVLLGELISKHGLTHVITFHNRIKQAENFSNDLAVALEVLPKRMKIPADRWTKHINGNMPTNQRVQLIRQFRDRTSGLSVFSNARCLNEGVDVRAVDGILFAEPKRSQTEIVQAVGRAIRPAKGPLGKNKVARIMIPVFIDPDSDEDDLIDKSRFKTIFNVLRALKDHDDVLEDELNGIRYGLGRRGGGGKLPPRITIDLPKGVSDKFVRSLEAHIIDSTTPSWEYWYGLLVSYKEQWGDCLVQARFETSDGHKLGNWVQTQRTRRDQLSTDRIKRLNEIGFEWDPYEADWQDGYQHLLEFHKEFGHTRVKEGYKSPDKFLLDRFLSRQRTNNRNGSLKSEHKQRLNDLGVEWDIRSANWEIGYEHLCEFYEEFGTTRVHYNYRTLRDDFALGSWVTVQRRFKAAGSLELEYQERLESIDFIWDPEDWDWQNGYAHLVAYKSEFGDLEVKPVNYKSPDGFNLGTWVGNQIKRRNKGTLSQDRISQLDSIGFIWDKKNYTRLYGLSRGILNDRFEKGYRHLLQFQEEFGHTRPSDDYETPEGFLLGGWIRSQRTYRRKETLPKEHQAKLDALGPEWF